MGRIRKFTQEAYDALQSGVSDDGEILDFFSDIPLNISNIFNSLEPVSNTHLTLPTIA